MNTLDRALALAARVPVFPCAEDKAPMCPKGFKSASQEPDQIRKLWSKYPGPLIGVPTGTASGLDALDIDPKHDGMSWWEEHKEAVPFTRAHKTRSGGLHVFFRHHETVRNTQSKIAKGVDTRGQGGYVIHWAAEGLPVYNPDILDEWPVWLLKRLTYTPPPPPPVPVTKCESNTRAAILIERAFARVSHASPGQRHYTLRAAAKTLGGLARFMSMSETALEAYLVQCIMATGAEDRTNAEKTAKWAVKWGRDRPLLDGH